MGANVTVEIGLPVESHNIGAQTYATPTLNNEPFFKLNNLSKKYVHNYFMAGTQRKDGENTDQLFAFGDALPSVWKLGKDGGYNGYRFGIVQLNGTIGDTGWCLWFSVFARNPDGSSSGCNANRITIFGDKTAGQYPTEIILDMGTSAEKTIVSDQNEVILDFDDVAFNRTVRITKWKRIGYNAVITHIEAFGNSIVFDEKWLKSVDSVAQSTATPNEVRFGLLANTGRMEINDFNGDIARYIKDGIISSGNAPVIVKAKNTTIQHHLSQDSEYLDNKFSVELTNRLSEMDNRKYAGRELSAETTLYSLICEVLETYLNGDKSFVHGDKYFDSLRISGASGSSEVTRSSKKTIPYVSNHKYYISYYFKADGSASGTTELFFPIVAGNSITSPAIQNEGEWQRASGIVQGVNTTGNQSFRIDYNNTGNVGYVDFRDIIILDLNASGLEDKSLAWCNENIITSADVDNMFTGYAYRPAYSDYLTLLQWVKYIKIPYPYLEPDTYRATIDKLCTVGLLRLYCDDNDNLKFVTALPTADPSELQINFGAYNIPKRYTFGGLKKSLFVKNKMNRVDIKENIVSYSEEKIGNLVFIGYGYDDNGNFVSTGFNDSNDFTLYDDIVLTGESPNKQCLRVYTKDIELTNKTKLDGFSAEYSITRRQSNTNKEYASSTKPVTPQIYPNEAAFVATLHYETGGMPPLKIGLIQNESTDKKLHIIFSVLYLQNLWGVELYTLREDISLFINTLKTE